MEAIFWARKLTIEKINQELNKNQPKKGWVSGQGLEIDNIWGVRYPVRIHMFDLTEFSDKTIDHMVMS